MYFPFVRAGDWAQVARNFGLIESKLFGPTATPLFATLTLSGLTASRLVQSNTSKALTSVTDLTNWVAGTANRVTVADDSDGSITLSGPQDIHTAASPTFAGLDLTGITDGRIPYMSAAGFADTVIQTDATNIGIGVSPTQKFEIGSTDNSDRIRIFHDNSTGYLKWTDGSFILQNEEDDVNSIIQIRPTGSGTGYGEFRVYDQDIGEYLHASCDAGYGNITVGGSSPQGLRFVDGANINITCFGSAAEGEIPQFLIYGYRTGDAKRSLQIGVGADAADQVSFDGVSTYYFDGKVKGLTGHLGGATNYSEFETDGTLKFNGDATVWDDLRVPVTNIRLGAVAPPTETAYKGGSVLAFSNTSDNTIYFTVQLPHSWKEGSNITPHIHWTIPTAGSGGGAENVKWDLTYSWANKESAFPANSSDTLTVDVQNDTADDHMYDDFSAIDGTGKTISSILICSLKRDQTVANDYGDDAYLVEIDFHYEIDTVGSRAILTK